MVLYSTPSRPCGTVDPLRFLLAFGSFNGTRKAVNELGPEPPGNHWSLNPQVTAGPSAESSCDDPIGPAMRGPSVPTWAVGIGVHLRGCCEVYLPPRCLSRRVLTGTELSKRRFSFCRKNTLHTAKSLPRAGDAARAVFGWCSLMFSFAVVFCGSKGTNSFHIFIVSFLCFFCPPFQLERRQRDAGSSGKALPQKPLQESWPHIPARTWLQRKVVSVGFSENSRGNRQCRKGCN